MTTTAIATTGEITTLSSIPPDTDTLLPTSQGNETVLTPYNDKTFKTVYTTLRCIQGIITIVVNVITINVITKHKKVSV